MTQNFFEGNDPFAFLRQMCANIGVPVPGMVFPTMDLADVERRIAEFKAVEQWLQMNLSTLQMTRQSLEMQRVAILSLTQMGTASQAAAAEAATTPAGNPFEAMAQLWQTMQQAAQQTVEATATATQAAHQAFSHPPSPPAESTATQPAPETGPSVSPAPESPAAQAKPTRRRQKTTPSPEGESGKDA
ncbi:PhaM family polyhydroxyalkanoate granule multifunctional regulatory protein [Tepidiphilus margaritifer]|uniref:PhaM family polyhydroxyalkanoate granule multifunctional regulatory protein n=1 Tax=Tepidiphilus margaritifer TaxID=203471 RepID=UPI000421F2EF|nr:PhaM family polyhydroxyalkanoate granule multifunctional regulatory protein [Tepidiphilus margaritifer]